MTEYYTVMVNEDETSWMLSLEGETVADCVRAIKWQWRGGNYQTMRVCQYDKATDSFITVSLEAKTYGIHQSHGETFQPRQGIYNNRAWQEFRDKLVA